NEKKPSVSAHVRSRRDGIIEYEDRRWEPDPETPSPAPAPSAQQVKSPTQAPTRSWEKPRRAPKVQDHVTEMAKHLSILPGFDRKLAWEAILALDGLVLARIQTGEMQMTELLGELRNLDLGDVPGWRRAQDGLTKVAAANE